MSDEITLRPSRLKYFVLVVGSLLAVLGGIFLLNNHLTLRDILIASLNIGFFGLCAMTFILQMLPGRSFLEITREGITLRGLRGTVTFPWAEIEEFGISDFTMFYRGIPQTERRVGIRFFPESPWKLEHPRTISLNKCLSSYDFRLPDNYGKKPEELKMLLDRAKSTYIRIS